MHLTRRNLLQNVAPGAAVLGTLGTSALSYSRILGANERLNVSVMGVRSRGRALIYGFAKAGCSVSTICDVDQPTLAEVAGEMQGKGLPLPQTLNDFRQALADPAIDALVIATPDHWHAPAASLALAAGKHVYVEKPCGHNPREGELLVAAQKRYGKVVQMGNQQRSAPESIELMQALGGGEIGEIYGAETWYANNRPSIGNGQQVPPPDGLDWDLWQGPAPRRPFHDNYVPYNWHWFWHWGTGETCNNAAHELDIARWALGVGIPERVSARGGRFFYGTDDWEMYDTLDLRLEYPGNRWIRWEGHSCNNVQRFNRGRGTLLLGTLGTALVDRSGYEIFDLAGQTVRSRFEAAPIAQTTDLVGADVLTDLHIANFRDAIRGTVRQHSPIAEGAISTLLCHLGNIAYRVSRDLELDPVTGKPHDAAAAALWAREYEPGWEPEATT